MKNKITLKNLSKLELLELLAEQEAEIEQLKKQLAQKDQMLQQRILKMNTAGNLAQAALCLNGVFEAAQKAADQYVESVKAMADQAGAGALPGDFCKRPSDAKRSCNPVQVGRLKYADESVSASQYDKNMTVDEVLMTVDKILESIDKTHTVEEKPTEYASGEDASPVGERLNDDE